MDPHTQGTGAQPSGAEIFSASLPAIPGDQIHERTLPSGPTLVVCPRDTVSWEDFVSQTPSRSIALDGYVPGPPKYSSDGPHANFNHHEGVDRLATRSTSAQILVAIKQGVVAAFKNGESFDTRIYVNDPDQDTCLAVWLLDNHERLSGTRSEPLINKLVYAEDLLDTTAGAYPFDPASKLMHQLAWVFEPYVQARISGRIGSMDGAGMADLISEVGARITSFATGQSGSIELDTNFEELGGGPGWKMIRETGAYARTGLFADGTQAFVSLISKEGGVYRYSVGKMSPYVEFPLEEIYAALNAAEGIQDKGWGGSDIIGGSPRASGSTLAPESVAKIINAVVEKGRGGES